MLRLLCLINSHRPIRNEVYRENGKWIGKCRHCGYHIRRKGRGQWRLDLLREL